MYLMGYGVASINGVFGCQDVFLQTLERNESNGKLFHFPGVSDLMLCTASYKMNSTTTLGIFLDVTDFRMCDRNTDNAIQTQSAHGSHHEYRLLYILFYLVREPGHRGTINDTVVG